MPQEIRKVGVIGAGTMGAGIVQVLALGGFEVVMRDLTDQILERAHGTITRMLDRAIEKGQIKPEARGEVLRRLNRTTRLGEVRDCQLVIEAIVEVEESKLELVAELNEICPPETIIASNTNSVSITTLGTFSRRADRLVGTHFMNPVPLTKLVEVVRGLATSDDTVTTVTRVLERVGKTAVVVNDSPGFVANRLIVQQINEAAFMLHEGVADAEAIDAIMKAATNGTMGPLGLADLMGVDTCLHIMEALHRDLGDDKYRPCPLMRRLVRAGRVGRKAGAGFYTYQQRT